MITEASVIVLNVKGRVADAVSDVLELASDAIRHAPEMAWVCNSTCITGIGNVGDRMLILI